MEQTVQVTPDDLREAVEVALGKIPVDEIVLEQIGVVRGTGDRAAEYQIRLANGKVLWGVAQSVGPVVSANVWGSHMAASAAYGRLVLHGDAEAQQRMEQDAQAEQA